MLGLLQKNVKPKSSKEVIDLLKNHKINTYNPLFIIQVLSKQSLLELQQFMKKQKTLNATQFMRFFRNLLPYPKDVLREQQFFIHYGLFKMFQQLCYSRKKLQVTFSEISSYIAEKLPTFQQEHKIQEKLLPINLDISQNHKKNIIPPEVYGSVLQDRIYFKERPSKSDRIQHMNRQVGQAEYSKKFSSYFYIDTPSPNIEVLDNDFNHLITLKTEHDISKRDMIVTFITWSDHEQKIACLLGNYSISMWSKQDNYKYQVNIPLPSQYLANPYVGIKYIQSMKKWIAYDNRPVFYVLSSYNYEPEYLFNNKKIRKQKSTQKILILELRYYSLLCIAFERNMFLISLKNKQIVSEFRDFKTSVTSIAFSESYQALFASTYESYFKSYELSEFQDFIERGHFQGHKNLISLLGVIENKPIVFSLQESSIIKIYDMRDYACYQSFSVLKNVVYKQILIVDDGICLVGSKLNVYKVQKQLAYKDAEDIIFLDIIHKNILVVTNKYVRVYDIRNGSLLKVVKAIFTSDGPSDIFSAYLMNSRDKLAIQNQDGQCVILQTNQMVEITVWKLDAKPFSMHYDDQNQLLTQVSLGTIQINQYRDQYCDLQGRRKIINDSPISYIKICQVHDLICLCYEDDDNLYFYAYEKGKVIGFLNFGANQIFKFKNVYIPPKQIKKIVTIQFIQKKNALYLLLSDRLLFFTYNRTTSTISFLLKQEIQLWITPIVDENQFIVEINDEQPLHSKGLALLDDCVIVVSNKANLFMVVQTNYQYIKLNDCDINKQNYNPFRVGVQNHQEAVDLKNPLIIIRDITRPLFEYKYFYYKQKFGNTIICETLGNLFVIADNKLNIIFWQSPNWSQIAGLINCELTLPKYWNIFKFSDKQIREVEYVLRYIDNQNKVPSSLIRSVIQAHIDKKQQVLDPIFSKITMTQLLEQNMLKNKGISTYRSSSLRQKKMILEKQRDQRQKQQNFEEHKKIETKSGKKNATQKSNTQKQIAQTLGYFNANHNETIIKKGLVEEEFRSVNILQKKMNSILLKDQKKSIVSYRSVEDSISTKKKIYQESQRKVTEPFLRQNKSQVKLEALSDRLGLKNYNSREILDKLKKQRSFSQKKMINPWLSKGLPRIQKKI